MTQTTSLEGPAPPALGRQRDFRLLLTSSALSWTGNAVVPLAVAFAVLDHGAPARDLALVLMAEVTAMVVLVLVGGVVTDRFLRKRVLVLANLARVAAGSVAAGMLLTGTYLTWLLAVTMAVYGAGAAFAQPAGNGLLNELVSDPRQRHQAAGLLMTVNGLAWIAGPALAGVVMGLAGSGAVFLVDAVLIAASAVAVQSTRPVASVPETSLGALGDLRVGWQEFTSRRWLWLSLASVGLMFCAVIAPLNALGPVIADQHFGGATAWAVIVVGLSVGRVGGGVLAALRLPARPLAAGAGLVLLMAPAMLALAGPAPFWVVVATQLLGGAGCGYFLAMWSGLLQNWVSPQRLGRVVAFDWLATLVGMPLGYLATAALQPAVGPAGVLTLSAVAVLVANIPLLASREVRELRGAPPRPVLAVS